MDFIKKCNFFVELYFFGEIRRAWNGTGMKWVRHELSIWGLNWDGHEMAWHEMGPAWNGTGMKWDTRAWNGTGMKWDWHEMAQSGMKWDGHEMGRHEMVRHEMAGMKWGWFGWCGFFFENRMGNTYSRFYYNGSYGLFWVLLVVFRYARMKAACLSNVPKE